VARRRRPQLVGGLGIGPGKEVALAVQRWQAGPAGRRAGAG
jgi:hypothetical protein